MATITLVGSETVQVAGLDSTGKPAATYEYPTLTQLTNFEGSQYVAAQQSVTSSTTPVQANFISEFNTTAPASFNLVAGGVYVFDIYLSITNGAAGGLKLAFGGTATATALSADTWAYNTTTLAAQGVITALSSNLVAYTGSVTTVNITGTISVATAGTFYLTIAQNVSNATATSLNVGSNFWVDRIA